MRLDQLDKIPQLLVSNLGDGEIIHARLGPAQSMIAVFVIKPAMKRFGARRPDEEIDVVLAPLVDDGRDVAMVQNVEAGPR